MSPESETQKIHYQRHYANTVYEKGALPSSSTNQVEPLHKLLKNAWRRSNKGKDSIDFILKENMTLAGFQSHIEVKMWSMITPKCKVFLLGIKLILDTLEECEDWDTEELPAVARMFKMGRG